MGIGVVRKRKRAPRPRGIGPAAGRSRAPATGEPSAEPPVSGNDDVLALVARARVAQKAWGVLPVEERAARLLRFRDALVDCTDDLLGVLAREAGEPRQEAVTHELLTTANLFTFYCQHAPRILANEPVSARLLPHRKGEVQFVPYGVVAVISSSELPFAIPLRSIVPALLAGNAVIAKPSERTPLVLLEVKKIYDSTGLPEDLFMVLVGGAERAKALVEAGIQRCVFTGSADAGRQVAAACGARLVPCTLELGGKAPALVCGDTNLERVTRAVVYGAFAGAGQMRAGVGRVYVNRAVYAPFVARVRELAAELRVGDPSSGEVDVGPLTSAERVEALEVLVRDALDQGAELVVGGHPKPLPGFFFEPTVLARCHGGMRVMRDEILGPLVAIQQVEDDDDAVDHANASPFGLVAYVFTRDRARGRRLARRIEAGHVVVNDVLVGPAAVEAPFGGMKWSGFGRVHGDQALRDMCQTRHVNVERLPVPSRSPFWFPYTDVRSRWLRRALRALFAGGGFFDRLRALF